MSDSLSNVRTGVKLSFGKLPTRKQECFYFEEDSKIYPVAYIRNEQLADAKRLWGMVLEGIPYKEDK
jgi:hypothetical protein